MHILIFGKADIINAHKTDCAIFIPLLRLRFKVIATSHEAPYKRDKWNALQKFYFHLAELVFIKSSNVCTCISQPLSNYYKKRYDKEVHFIANGINVTKRPDYDYQRAESSLPVGASLYQPFILFSARRLMSTKGCHTMLEALHLINYKGQVFITGELENSPYLNKLKNLAEHLNVFFLGYVDPLNVLLALVDRSSLFIFPSETEGMSIMLLEVASVGKPIIASNIPENIQVFDGNEVLYFETGNAQDLAIKTAMAIDSLEYMQSLGLSARQKVYSSYLWRDIAKQYDKIFSSILK